MKERKDHGLTAVSELLDETLTKSTGLSEDAHQTQGEGQKTQAER